MHVLIEACPLLGEGRRLLLFQPCDTDDMRHDENELEMRFGRTILMVVNHSRLFAVYDTHARHERRTLYFCWCFE